MVLCSSVKHSLRLPTAVCSPLLQGLRREPVLLGHQILANRRHDGWLSLSALCTVPSIQAWFRREAPDKQHDQHAMMDHMLHALDQHASAKGTPSFQLGSKGADDSGVHERLPNAVVAIQQHVG